MIALVLRAGCVAVTGSICALTLRRYVPELALVLGLVTAGAVVVLLLSAAVEARDGLNELADLAGLDSSLTTPVFKVTAIAIITRLSSQICRDAGEGTVAVCCELAGTAGALTAVIPLIRKVLDLLGGLLT